MRSLVYCVHAYFVYQPRCLLPKLQLSYPPDRGSRPTRGQVLPHNNCECHTCCPTMTFISPTTPRSALSSDSINLRSLFVCKGEMVECDQGREITQTSCTIASSAASMETRIDDSTAWVCPCAAGQCMLAKHHRISTLIRLDFRSNGSVRPFSFLGEFQCLPPPL